MSTKAAITTERVRVLVREHLEAEAAEIEPLTGGDFSRAFAFTSDCQGYVLRVNAAPHAAEGFAKDDYAWRHFAAPDLPIPRIVAIGQAPEGHIAISARAAGQTLHAFSAERRALLPATLDTLDAILRTDVRATRGYGDWGGDGHGTSARWRDFLVAVMDNHTEGFYRDWHVLFRTSFLEREVYEAVYRLMLRLIERCPEERALLHNDYWFENILADDERITGVIDWANALYGDPLYSIAQLAWGSNWPGWWHEDGEAILRARYGAMPGYDVRIACYQCHLALDDLRFYATTGRRAEYDWARARLMARVAEGPGDA